jgi:histidine decarboxylase
MPLGLELPERARRPYVLGYPVNLAEPPEDFLAWQAALRRDGLGQAHFNNVGNPFLAATVPYSLPEAERAVIQHFAGRLGFAPGEAWGFVSNGGTDSNLYGLYLGRTILKAQTGRRPRVYFTREAHYSIQIVQDLLGLEGAVVAAASDGAMDPEDLRAQLAAQGNEPALVVATLGTTFRGAIDPLDRLREALRGRPHHLHLDAALFGGYLPYTPQRAAVLQRTPAGPRYDSIAVSCHKFFGFPSPAGLYLTSRSHFEAFLEAFGKVHDPAYVHQVPGTLSCSRDAVKPAEFCYFTTPAAERRLAESAAVMLEDTAWLLAVLEARLPHLEAVRADPRSNIVHFRAPGRAVVAKYALATAAAGRDGRRAHVVVMPHVTRAVLAEFLDDLARDPVVAALAG